MNAATSALSATVLTATAVFAIFKILENQNLKAQQNNSSNVSRLIDPLGPDVQFILFTRNNKPYNLKLGNNTQLEESGFNKSNPTKIITHGFLSSIENDVFLVNKDAYIETGDYNVIGMDWSVLCQAEYVSAIRGARIAGLRLANFTNWLTQNGVPLDSIHLIGHSLGAHVVGIAGSKILGGKVFRITGLDPAGPGFSEIKEELRLDKSDAILVEVIHTYLSLIGTALPLGHIDFYPNGGQSQPGCPFLTSFKFSELIYCNHGRSHQLFAESIRNPRAFKSRKCRSLEDVLKKKCKEKTEVYMGQPDTYSPGLYYFSTRDSSPYSLGGD